MNGIYYTVLLLLPFSCLAIETSTSTPSSDYEDEYETDGEDEYFENTTFTNNGTLNFTRQLRNITTDAGKQVKLVCIVENFYNVSSDQPKVTFQWKKNEVPIENSKRIKIVNKHKKNKYSSVLKISKVDALEDSGFYKCLVSNKKDRLRSQAVLQVNSAFKDSAISNAARIRDAAMGYIGDDLTTPQITQRSAGGSLPTGTISFTNMKDTFDLEFSPTGELTPTQQQATVPNVTEPFCQKYKGERCKDLLGGKYVFIQPLLTQKDIEDKLNNAFLVISQSNDISSECEKYVHPSMCYSAFPICVDPKPVNRFQKEHVMKDPEYLNHEKFSTMRNTLTKYLRRVCKEDCLMLETEICLKEYAIAKRHPIIGQIPQLEECEILPEEIDESHCLSLGVELQNVDKEHTCFWDQGNMYRGVQDFTVSGKKCLRWSHQFHISLGDNPELTGHNYCRNPDNLEQEPFCYVDANEREVCGVSKCVYLVGMYIAAIVLGSILIISLLTFLLCCRNKKKFDRNLQKMNTQTADKNIYGNHSPTSSTPMEMNRLLPPNLPPQRSQHGNKGAANLVPQFTHKEVVFIEELGEGAFGKVYKGELKAKNGLRTYVAVKSLKENASAKTQADFQREIELISELKHPNIICLLGVVLKQEPVCMLFEYMSEGDLHEFLIANSPSEGKCLTQNQFLHIAIQIAQGMEYLSENHYVHRDLAARNCLVSKDLVVKISDFGLSRDMYSCDYYRVQSKSLLPVRWMPPESILYGKFTTESDVWSYGVVLWEIYSYGLQPYYGFNNQEVINMIRSRQLLPCPDSCPSYCYSLMVECWAELAIRRPNFTELVHRLRMWKNNRSVNGPSMYKTPEHQLQQQQKYGHSSKSSHSSENPCGYLESASEPVTMERNLKCGRLNESQNSLSSRCSSLGNRTQSTSLSNDIKGKRRKKHGSLDRNNPKNMVVSSVGDNIEIKIDN